MRPFRYELAATAAAAVAAATERREEGAARYLGGGTNLVDLMRLGVEQPAVLVDVARLDHAAIEPLPDGGLRIGAAARNSDVAVHPAVRARYPVLSQALLSGASPQLRNVATIAGNLLQRTRCAYFTDVTAPCNKRDPGSGCPAIAGHHRNHAILGHSPRCVATHPSDLAVALAALGAAVRVIGPAGVRTVPMPGLHRLPGDDPSRDTVLRDGELVVAVELAPLRAAARSRYRKVRDRASFAFAVVSAAVALDLDGDRIKEGRIALGGVAHAPWRATRAEAALAGVTATEAAFAAAADAELAAAAPLRDNAYKVPLVRDVLVRTLVEAAAR